jgi:oxaloacetate decarboxylase alpha subunit
VAAFEFTPASVTDLWLERLVANGVCEVRISDCSNTVSVWERLVRDSHRVGLKTVLNLIYSVSPVHTDDYYAKLARAAVKLRTDRICLKDPGGLLTPDRTRILVPMCCAGQENSRRAPYALLPVSARVRSGSDQIGD